MKTVQTYTATIYVGTRVGRSAEPAKAIHSISEIEDVCQRFCDAVGLCVTVTPTRFIYKAGNEDGAAVGLINYPRFPKSAEEIRELALALADLLRSKMDQFKVSVVFPDETVMIGDDLGRTDA